MIIVYSAANNLEAHMIKGVLEQQEIPAYIQGEHLQSGAGELPAMSGLVKISVDDINREAARKIIKEWETQELAENASNLKNVPNEIVSAGTNYLYLVASFIAGAIAMHLYMQSPVSHSGIDLNNDEINDIRWTYKNNMISKTEADFNFDQKIDEISTFDSGLSSITKVDTDFDGIFDAEYQYTNERVSEEKIDTNNDGEMDIITEYESPLNYSSTIFNPKTNLIIKVQHFKRDKLVTAELDTNNDGKVDTAILYDLAEEESNRKPIVSN